MKEIEVLDRDEDLMVDYMLSLWDVPQPGKLPVDGMRVPQYPSLDQLEGSEEFEEDVYYCVRW